VKRSGPLRRVTPLRRSAPLRASQPPRSANGAADSRSARRKRNTAPGVPADIYQAVAARDWGCRAERLVPSVRCWGRLDPHHVHRRSQGGQDTVENLILLCRAHHSWVHEHPADSAALGLLRLRGAS
jgi:5-methylcytosine-specific restriction endonuclease McrA